MLLPLFPWSRRGLTGFGLVLVAAIVPFALVAPSGLWDSIHTQRSRPLQVENLGGSASLAPTFAPSTRTGPTTSPARVSPRCRR